MEKREKLIDLITEAHGEQVRKYTKEPYVNHLLSVANAADTGLSFAWEIGLCHDFLEDTVYNDHGLNLTLRKAGYGYEEIPQIIKGVEQLTDVFTAEKYPYLNRSIRKQCEALRLHTIDKVSQTVKCYDIIDNASTIIPNDPSFARVYVKEVRDIVKGFKLINSTVKSQVWNCILDAEEQLKSMLLID